MKYTKEEMWEIINDDHEEYTVIDQIILSHNRWTVGYEAIVQNINTKQYYKLTYFRGATEMQEDYICVDNQMIKVEPVEVKKIEYLKVNNE